MSAPSSLGTAAPREPEEPPAPSAAARADAAVVRHLVAAAERPIDPAALVAFRVFFGLLGLVSSVRFLALGWVERFFGEPTFFFRYYGLEWVPVPSVEGVTALFVAMAVASVGVTLGVATRLCAAVFLVAFTWVELIDVTNYLNHYYLVSLLGLLVVALPLGRFGRVFGRAGPDAPPLRAWMLWLLRFQILVVYTYAGVAKMGADWLVHGQPLGIWLSARTDLPLIGPWLDEPAVAVALSWLGMLHDVLVPWLLLWHKSRAFAYLALLAFHTTTGLLFNIGMFPVIMTLGATVFFAPDWPRKVARALGRLAPRARALARLATPWAPPTRSPRASPAVRRAVAAAVTLFVAWQVLMPLRTHAYGGDVLWHEQGMRWSWRVMLREKNGDVMYRVVAPGEARPRLVHPRSLLTAHQEREMSGQPDLILQLAHRIRDDHRARLGADVAVYADAFASLNGRPPARLIDPTVDLARVDDGLAAASWILPAPPGPPPARRPLRLNVPRTTPRTGP